MSNPSEDVAAMKDFWGEEFGAISSHLGWDVEIFMEKLRPMVTAKSVLELGCGAGLASLSLAKYARSVTGVDFQPKLLDIARCHAARSQYQDHVQFREQNVLDLDLGAKYDVVCGTAVLHEIPSLFYPKLLERMKAHLAYNGCCVFWKTTTSIRYIVSHEVRLLGGLVFGR